MPESGAELRVAHGEEIAGEGLGALVADRISRSERRFSQLARELDVVGTNILADVAAIDVRPDRLMKRVRDVSLRFDREIRNATPGVQHPRLDERVRWAGVQTARAASATVGLER